MVNLRRKPSDISVRGLSRQSSLAPALTHQLLDSYGSMWVVRRTANASKNASVRDSFSSADGGVVLPIQDNVVPNTYTDVFMLHESSEPVACGIDFTTGHLILSYMEEYLHDQDKLQADWDTVNAYNAEEATPCVDAERPENMMKNRLNVPLPYEQTRVRLRNTENDYINASLIYDHSPRNPIYISTPSPMLETLSDFWEMIWEQSSVVLVCLQTTDEIVSPKNVEEGKLSSNASVQYWPNEGKGVYGKFEVHLVSEHSWCENYIVRSFYLKNLSTGETRTVTQFHYLTWSDKDLKLNSRPILEFRRKVNRSFRSILSPIVVHCSDGSGRTGTYILLDLVLNRIAKGIKEINIVATLEHLRDQRQKMVQSKEQYEFVFTAVAQEVEAMLKTGSSTANM